MVILLRLVIVSLKDDLATRKGMDIAVVGAGWVGAVMAVVLVEAGHSVIAFDNNIERVASFQRGDVPFHEPGFTEALQAALATGRLQFATLNDVPEKVGALTARVAFLCVPTPSGADGSADLTILQGAAAWSAARLPLGALLVVKSTTPPGTAVALSAQLGGYAVATNPEFLAESTALRDAREPSRIVVGALNEQDHALLRQVYASWIESGTPYVALDCASAEMSKYAANAFLAVKVSYANELSRIAEAVGANPAAVLQSLGFDDRIGKKFLRYGLGWGGGCFPKDVRALQRFSVEASAPTSILSAAYSVNADRISYYADKIAQAAGGSLAGVVVAQFGLAFKAGTDDVRESPAIFLMEELLRRGALVRVYDPAPATRLTTLYPSVVFVESIPEALQSAQVAVIATDWPDFAELRDPSALRIPFVDARP
jgi:UDPglucose 6-dehydrogenase